MNAHGAPLVLLLVLMLVAHAAAPVPAQAPDRLDDATVRQAVERVTSSPDFRHLTVRVRADEKGLLERLLEWLFGSSEEEEEHRRTGGGLGLAGLLSLLLYLLAAVAIALAIFFIVLGLSRTAGRHVGGAAGAAAPAAVAALVPAVPPGEQPANVYLERALVLARAGEYRAAIAQLLLGGMSWLERAGAIRFRKGLTNRDYLRAARGHPRFRTGLGTIVGHFEETHFGRRPATSERFQTCLENFQRSLTDDRTE
jgi:hypothetical protein